MLLPYASVKHHDPATHPCCSPRAPGHMVCQNEACPGRTENDGAGRPATMQTRRHATAQEYAALPLAHIPIDRIAHQAVFTCDHCAEHGLEPFCEHAPPTEAPPCPDCGATGEDPCLRRDGVTPLWFTHASRTRPEPERCTHAHRAGCDVFQGCTCTGDEPPPTRPEHPAKNTIEGPGPDTSRLLFEPELAQMLLQHHGVHWWQVRTVESGYTQDNKPAIRADVAQVDEQGHLRYDEHGHEIRQDLVIVIEAPPQ